MGYCDSVGGLGSRLDLFLVGSLPMVLFCFYSFLFLLMDTELFLSMMEVLNGYSRGGTEVRLKMVFGAYEIRFARHTEPETFDYFVKWLQLSEVDYEFEPQVLETDNPYVIVIVVPTV